MGLSRFSQVRDGGVAEWSIAAVLKAVIPPLRNSCQRQGREPLRTPKNGMVARAGNELAMGLLPNQRAMPRPTSRGRGSQRLRWLKVRLVFSRLKIILKNAYCGNLTLSTCRASTAFGYRGRMKGRNGPRDEKDCALVWVLLSERYPEPGDLVLVRMANGWEGSGKWGSEDFGWENGPLPKRSKPSAWARIHPSRTCCC